MDWDKLRVFHAVALAGSFTHAGEDLNLSQSAVSRQISALEEDLSAQLFHRHARGLILTEQGGQLYETAHEMSDKLALVQTRMADARSKPSGVLRVTTTVGFGSTWLTPRVKEFLEIYPDIELSLICDDRSLDLGMREADVAIRIGEPTQPELVKRRLFTVRNFVYASQEYLRIHEPLETVADLDQHKIIAYGDHAPPTLRNVNWLRELGANNHREERRAVLQVNNVYGLLLAVESGLGIASLPEYMVRGNEKLVRILPELAGPSFDYFFVYPLELRNMKRLAVFREFLLHEMEKWDQQQPSITG